MKKKFVFIILTLSALNVFGQGKEIALLPFTGGQTSDGEYIVSAFARQRDLRSAFTKVTLVTRTTQAFMQFEQRFQRMSGLTDADTIFELGKQLNASHVMAGYITKFGNQNLVLVSVLDVESLQQIAGDYQTYQNIEEIADMIPAMARNLARHVRRDTSKLPGLSVPPFDNINGVNESDAQVLAQILAIGLANGNKYAVLPRTESLQKVLEEHNRQRSGLTDQERVKRLGVGKNAQYVLASSAQKLGTLTSFTADVLDIRDGSYIDGYEKRYQNFSQGLDLMPELAAALNGDPAQALSPGQKPMPANMVRIAGGMFTMGSPSTEAERLNDETQRSVTISKPFYIGKYEVTQKEWVEVMGSNPSYFKGDNLPVESVSWYDAIEYCNRRSEREGLTPAYTIDKTRSDGNNTNGSDNVKWVVTWNRNANGYRLPTEAEWELACRAGTATPFYTGNNITTSHANYDGNKPYNNNAKGESRGKTWAVGSGTPNPWGLYDMAGNVSEWCWDWSGPYDGNGQTDPTGVVSSSSRIVRGGNWYEGAFLLRSARRGARSPSSYASNFGFRVVRP